MTSDQIQTEEESIEEMCRKHEQKQRRGKVMGGLLLISIGSLFLARELGAEIPVWVFSWEMLLIGIGITLAVKHKFQHPGWILLILIGGSFLAIDVYPEVRIKPILWPSIFILLGILLLFKPRRKKHSRMHRHWKHAHLRHRHFQDVCGVTEKSSKDDFIESTAFMAGVRKVVLSKNFKGGDISNVFGGTELNLSQADFEDKAALEITQVFGGTKLLVPTHWEIRSELVTIVGSVEDKRNIPLQTSGEPKKTLVLTGTTVFGGIEIKSF
jgi:predicted membrane protein